MGFTDFFKKTESLISVDVGASSMKLVELDVSGLKPKLLNVGISAFAGDVFGGNTLSKSEKVSEQLTALLDANGVSNKRVITAVPAPSVFTKRIKTAKVSQAELANNIQFEAGSFIPHNIDAVRLDFHVLGESKNQFDVLVVAVKNEIIESFLDCLALSGLETAVVDVDYFAIQNMFEMSYPELIEKTVALINVGARYSGINICRNGVSLFTGDISVGGKQVTEAISTGLKVTFEEAEKLKKLKDEKHERYDAVRDIIDRQVEAAATEFNRQLSFFWNASGAEESIEKIMLSGGGALIPGLVEELSEKTGIACEIVDPFRGVECGPSVDVEYLKELAPFMGVCVGMGIRQPGDKIIPVIEEDE